MNRYTANDARRVLIIEGDRREGEAAAKEITAYFEKRSIPVACDWVNSVARSLLQIKYYEYDVAVVALRPQPDESGIDFPGLMEERQISFPVLLIVPPDDGAAAEEAFRLGAADVIVRGENYFNALPEAVDNAILRFHARRDQERLAGDVREKNKELRVMNELLARQSVRFLKLKKEQEGQRRKMESLLNAMSEGVVFVNSRRNIEMLNPAARAIFRADGAAGFTFDALKAFTGIDPFEIQAKDEVPAAIFSTDYRVASRIVEEDGAQTGRMMVLRNVTQEREVERLKAEFQSMVSHELRTPLTAIRGAVENFLRGTLGAITEQQRAFLTMILRNVERQTLLINDMLDLAKLEANMMSLKATQMEPEYAARLSHESFRYACADKGVSLELRVAEGLPKIYADEGMVCQILDNLLANALKFTPKGGTITLEVVSLAGEADPMVAFRVTDSGIGVPDHLKEKIFDRYFQADSSIQRQYKGTGLGLAICRKMADLHNGTVTAADAPGGGAVFTLRLPVSLALRKKIVLAVADAGERGKDEEILRREFHCITAMPGDDVLAKITETLPQLVLIDYLEGGMNGYGIYGEMKKNPATARIPVIFLGDGLTEGDKVQALKAGAADVIARPYNAGEFLARVKRTAGGAA